MSEKQKSFKILIGEKGHILTKSIQKNSFTIGRSSKSDFVFQNNYLSNQHLKFTYVSDKEIYIEDLNSTNGTYLNGKKLEAKVQYKFQYEDKISIKGNIDFIIRIVPIDYDATREVRLNDLKKINTIPVKQKSSEVEEEYKALQLIKRDKEKIQAEYVVLKDKLDKETTKIKSAYKEKTNELVKLKERFEKNKGKLEKLNAAIEKNSLAFKRERIIFNKEAHEKKKEYNQLSASIKELSEEISKLSFEHGERFKAIELIRREYHQAKEERDQVNLKVNDQYTALKAITEKKKDMQSMYDAISVSFEAVAIDLDLKSREYTELNSGFSDLKSQYDALKSNVEILDKEKKRLAELYLKEKSLFDSDIEEKKKKHIEEMALETERLLATRKETLHETETRLQFVKEELETLDEVYQLKIQSLDESLENHKKNEEEKKRLEIALIENELTGANKLFETKKQEVLTSIEKFRESKIAEVETEAAKIKILAQKELEIQSSQLKDLKEVYAKEEQKLESIKLDIKNYHDEYEKLLADLDYQRQQAISEADHALEKELRTLKLKKVQEIALTIGQHAAKDLAIRKTKTIDDGLVEKFENSVKRIIVEKMMANEGVETERTKMLVLDDVVKKKDGFIKNREIFIPYYIAISVLVFFLSMSFFFPEVILDTKSKILGESDEAQIELMSVRKPSSKKRN